MSISAAAAAMEADLDTHGISQWNIQNARLQGDQVDLSTDPNVAVREVQRYALFLHLEQGDMANEYRSIENQLIGELQAQRADFEKALRGQEGQFSRSIQAQKQRFKEALATQEQRFNDALEQQREASRTLERTVHDLEAKLARLTTHCMGLDGKVQASEHQRLKMEAIMRIQLDKIDPTDWKSFGNSAIEDRRFPDINQKVETNKGAMVLPAHTTASSAMPPPRAMPRRRPPTAVRAALVAEMPAAPAAAQSSSSGARQISMRPVSSSSSSS